MPTILLDFLNPFEAGVGRFDCQGGKHEGRVLSEREKSVIVMRLSIENTVKNSYRPAHGEEQRKSSGWRTSISVTAATPTVSTVGSSNPSSMAS
jgi:hypothetical protein